MHIREVVDLSWPYTSDMRVFPGGIPMVIRKEGSTARGDVCEITTADRFCIHFGTHLDCPAHMVGNGFRAEDKDAAYFVGRGKVLDCTGYPPGSVIGSEILDGVDLTGVDFLLFHTGWAEKFKTDEQYGDFPVLDLEFARWLGVHPALRGIGIETNNCDRIGDERYGIHKALLGNNSKVLYEALRNLDRLLHKEFLLVAPPILLECAEAGPCRAVALVLADEEG